MRPLKDMSIRGKLVLICMLTAMVGLSIAAFSFYLYDAQSFRAQLATNYEGLAAAIAPSTATALLFEDTDYAEELLGQLLTNDDVLHACIYDLDEDLFASMSAENVGVEFSPPPVSEETYQFEGSKLHIFHTILSEDDAVGTIFLAVQLPDASERAYSYLGVVLGVSLLSLFTAFIFSSQLARIFSRPIVELVAISKEVSAKNNYSLRAKKTTQDEMGDLIDSFNAMLTRVEAHDQQLEDHRNQLEKEVRERTQEIRKLSLGVEQSPATMVITDIDGRPEYVNQRFTDVTGYTLEEALENDPNILKSGKLSGAEFVVLGRALVEGSVWSGEFQNQRKNGEIFWESARVAPLRDEYDQITHHVWLKEDITERKRTEEQLFYDASHDSLTGLANRAFFIEQLSAAIVQSKRYPHSTYAVLFMDLDRFKVINDSLGHAAGDGLLIESSRRLEKCLRESDLIARLGGDEFAVLINSFSDEQMIIHTAERIQYELSRPYHLKDQEVFTSASIGIAIGNTDYSTAEEIIRDADVAMYRAKHAGKAQYALFDVELNKQAMARLELEKDLRTALEREQFTLYYQPIISIKTKRTVGFEALIRWIHPEKGIVSPLDFIPIAEETGLISPLGWWILQTACVQLKTWQDMGAVDADTTVAVNISGKQFLQTEFSLKLKKIVGATGLNPTNLKLEVTESVIAQNPEYVAEILDDIKAMGSQLCIDDFGTGYSSFSYLHRFPFDVLKIDRSFVGSIDTDPETLEICRALVAMAANLDLTVVAEGVEEFAQLELLEGFDCPMAQGYLIAKPLMSEDVPAFIAAEPDVWYAPSESADSVMEA